MSTPASRDLARTILTEHFGYAPETFAKQGMDLANVSMYAAVQAVETELMKRVEGAPEVEMGTGLDEEEVLKGCMRLETLLESQIDRHFELFDLYILRNTFAISEELIPYLELRHQKGIKESLRGKDDAAIADYQEELRLYEEEVTKERELAFALAFMERKVQSLKDRAEEIGWLKGAETLESRTLALTSQTSFLSTQLEHLLSTRAPVPSTSSAPTLAGSTSQPDPWDGNRAAFINWAATGKVEQLAGTGASDRSKTSVGVEEVKKEVGETGSAGDAKSLADTLAGSS